MRKNSKRALYENIMKNVAKQVKRTLNEEFDSDVMRLSVTDYDEVIIPVLKARLAKAAVEFQFNKADGSFRIAKGTTNRDIINQLSPSVQDSDPAKIRQAKTCPPDVIKFFDIEKLQWRSCKAGRLVKILDNDVDIDA